MGDPRKSVLAQQMREIVARPRVQKNVKLVAEKLGAFRVSTGGSVYKKDAKRRQAV